MNVYLTGNQYSITNSLSNLFTLRWDLRLGLFDQAAFVIVPKLGKLVVHFLIPTQSAERYHNVQFDLKNSLSHEALYARFAWALMDIVKGSTVALKKDFRFLTASGTDDRADDSDGDEDGGWDEGGGADEYDSGGGEEGGGRSGGGRGGGRGGRGGVKRKREYENEDDEIHDDMGTTSDPGSGRRRSGSHVTSDACPREGRAWPTSHLPELYADVIEPDGSQLLLDSEARELEEDMKKASRTLPFFVDPNVKVPADYYEEITWYPGSAIVERRKQAYLDAHPQIRAHSDQLLPADYNLSDDENLV
ncbi:uncharacterized protein LACBIDRAFT_307506 [Laccaria bicolor S238N-H82]|uniref:Predicted protein n=1 Tax=Laccaria bicolor (strain S238N-H82 / ATCC MYA-4686) TaxID=486041 RepID=B0DQB4_LACBS|nr:uncharacterized protein LACBIDRAFT_307506 [Laccaria bicolor S238N-H82]EDR03264.1 predicted protein [Laccaria bicolor S238N-H82]|eukprot:XP_001886060.1 predicted protein [Laccaria bicolor S238N-H82]